MDKEIERAKDLEELNRLQLAAIRAEEEQEAFRMITIQVPDLIGHKVEHPLFGKGAILSLDSYRLNVRFGHDERVFLYPDVFLKNNMSFSAPADMVCLVENESLKKQYEKAKLLAKEAREAYDRKSMDFSTSW